ncbi:3433_t:CDS:1, partial [Acaulospora morrowiae]
EVSVSGKATSLRLKTQFHNIPPRRLNDDVSKNSGAGKIKK